MTVTYTHEVADARLGGFSSLLLKWRGSVYKLFYKEFIIYMTLYTVISASYRYQPSPEFKLYFEKLCLQFRAYTDQIPISFVLGFYVAIVVGRWWNQFQYVPWPDRMMVVMCSTVHGADDRGRLIRRTLIRYLNLMQVLTYRSISTAVFKRFPTDQHVVDAGFMTQAELKILNEVESNNLKYWIPACWFSTLLSKTRQEGRILDDITYNKLLEEMNTFRGCCGMLLSYDWISVPLVYTQVVTVAVYMYFASCLLGSQYLDPEMHYDNHTIDLYVPIVTIGQFFFYVGWLKVAEQLINPFGEDDDDFEANWLIDRNLELSYLAVDQFYMKHPKLERDIWWNSKRPEAPYTAASMSHRVEPFMGSTYDMSLNKDESKFLTQVDQNGNEMKSTVINIETPETKQGTHDSITLESKNFKLKSFTEIFKKKLKLTGIPLTKIKEQSMSRLLLDTERINESSDDDSATLSPVSSHENTDDEKDENKSRSRRSSLSSNNEDNDQENQTQALSAGRRSKPSSSEDLSCSVARKKVRREVSFMEHSSESKSKRRTKKRTMRGKLKKSSEGDTEQERRNALMRVRPELKTRKKTLFADRRERPKPRQLCIPRQFPSDFSIPGASSPSPKLLRWAFKSKNRNLYDDMVSLTSSVHSEADDQNDLSDANKMSALDITIHNPLESSQSMPFTEELRRRLQVYTTSSPFATSPVHEQYFKFNSTTTSVMPSPTYGHNLEVIGEAPEANGKSAVKLENIPTGDPIVLVAKAPDIAAVDSSKHVDDISQNKVIKKELDNVDIEAAKSNVPEIKFIVDSKPNLNNHEMPTETTNLPTKEILPDMTVDVPSVEILNGSDMNKSSDNRLVEALESIETTFHSSDACVVIDMER